MEEHILDEGDLVVNDELTSSDFWFGEERISRQQEKGNRIYMFNTDCLKGLMTI